MAPEAQFLRRASPNEQRTICREDAGYYHAVIVGAVYDLGQDVRVDGKHHFFSALKQCIDTHPWLCVVVGNRQSDHSTYNRVSSIHLPDHIHICEPIVSCKDADAIANILEADLDVPFPPDKPHWRILVLGLQSGEYFVGFSYSHMIGDGLSGSCFHRTFLDALRARKAAEHTALSIVTTIDRPLPPPFDTPERLPISWMFLLLPLIATLMPRFLVNLLGLRTSSSVTDEGTWTATRVFFDTTKSNRSKLRMFDVEPPILEKVLHLSRANEARLTGILLQLITRVLSRAIPDSSISNFVSQTAVNMRRAVGVPETEMGEFVSGCYTVHPRSMATGPLTKDEWAAAVGSTHRFALASSDLNDQPIGLLRYLPSMMAWTLSKIGTMRDCSIEMSNLGSFDQDVNASLSNDGNYAVRITKMVFAQPGHVTGPPISFNFVSVKQGYLVFTVTWQEGALGISGDEGEFVDRLCEQLKAELQELR